MFNIKIAIVAALLASSYAYPGSFEDMSPFSERNSQFSEQNSQFNERNSQFNEANSTSGFGDNSRIIRDNEGNATSSYGVPRTDGGVNYYDRDGGGRTGYSY